MNEQLKLTDTVSLRIEKNEAMREQLTLRGDLYVMLLDGSGIMKTSFKADNTVTNAGRSGIMDQLLASPTLNKQTHMAIGTDTPSGTALGNENARVAFDSKTRSSNVVTHVATFGPGIGTGAITEAGIFDANSGGNMWMSASFAAVNKGASDTLVITWTLTAT